jgi:hypothetical protein
MLHTVVAQLHPRSADAMDLPFRQIAGLTNSLGNQEELRLHSPRMKMSKGDSKIRFVCVIESQTYIAAGFGVIQDCRELLFSNPYPLLTGRHLALRRAKAMEIQDEDLLIQAALRGSESRLSAPLGGEALQLSRSDRVQSLRA